VAETARVAILGGSSAFVPGLAAALAGAADRLPRLEVRLQGRDARRVAAVARFCGLHARSRGARHEYVATTAVGEAARGAEVVVNMIRVGGWAGRSHDERFPLAAGLPGDETIGPGGLASALRTVPVVVAAAREVAAVAPGCRFVNLTNPMGILLAALHEAAGIEALGLCELPAVTLARALALVGGREPSNLEADYLGVNHQGWFVRVAAGGEDLLPRIFAAVARAADPRAWPVAAGVMRRIGALPLPYLRLYYHTARETRLLRSRRTSRGAELAALSGELHRHYAETSDPGLPAALRRRDTPWFELALVPALAALLGGAPELLYVSERNRGDLPGLPPGAIVEKRCLLGPEGARIIAFTGAPPVAGGALEPFLAFLRGVAAFEDAALRAALDPSPEPVRAALLLHPLRMSHGQAERLIPLVLQPLAAAGSLARSGP
jgi:6-phospho-beta-glucosidase